MPQELQVLRCYHCSMFQVHIIKKISKWCCKVCNEKQSIKRVYFIGTGKECRERVMTFNKEAILAQNENDDDSEHENDEAFEEIETPEDEENRTRIDFKNDSSNSGGCSKWDQFLPPSVSNNSQSDEENLSNEKLSGRYTFERPRKIAKTK